jgi:hypothetical protein
LKAVIIKFLLDIPKEYPRVLAFVLRLTRLDLLGLDSMIKEAVLVLSREK